MHYQSHKLKRMLRWCMFTCVALRCCHFLHLNTQANRVAFTAAFSTVSCCSFHWASLMMLVTVDTCCLVYGWKKTFPKVVTIVYLPTVTGNGTHPRFSYVLVPRAGASRNHLIAILQQTKVRTYSLAKSCNKGTRTAIGSSHRFLPQKS